jgi:hypothetical protein
MHNAIALLVLLIIGFSVVAVQAVEIGNQVIQKIQVSGSIG